MSTNVNTDFETSLSAITQDAFVPFLTENIFNKNTMLEEIKAKSEVTIVDGGTNLQVPIIISKNTNVDSFEYLDQVGIDPQAGFVNATYDKAYYGVQFPISYQELQENKGNSKIVDLMGARLDQAIMSLNDRLNTDMYLDGTGNSSKNLLGLLAMIPTSSTSSTYADIDGTATGLTDWTQVYKAGAVANTFALIDSAYYAASDGNDKPNLMVTDALGMTNYNTYLRAATGIQSMVSPKKADGSYAIISHLGVEIMLDQAAPQYSSTLPIYHMLNTKYLGFYFDAEPMKRVDPSDQYGTIFKSPVTCQLVTSRRNRQAKVAITS